MDGCTQLSLIGGAATTWFAHCSVLPTELGRGQTAGRDDAGGIAGSRTFPELGPAEHGIAGSLVSRAHSRRLGSWRSVRTAARRTRWASGWPSGSARWPSGSEMIGELVTCLRKRLDETERWLAAAVRPP